MIKIFLFVSINLFLALNLACSNAAAPNSETNKAVVVNANSANMPAGLSANQIPPTNEPIPGIPDPKSVNANNSSSSASPIPGIPDTTKMGQTPQTKKTPPIPGIPDEETLKKQMTTPVDRSIMDRKPPESESNSANRPNTRQRRNLPGSNPNR